MSKVKKQDFPLTASLGEIKEFLTANWDSDGCICPACKKTVKLNPISINNMMAYRLCVLYNLTKATYVVDGKFRYFHVSDDIEVELKLGGGWAKLRWWDLIEQKPKEKGKGNGRTSGMWRITQKGIKFVENRIAVPKYVKLFNSKSYGFYGDQVRISDCFENRFDYEKLMVESQNMPKNK